MKVNVRKRKGTPVGANSPGSNTQQEPDRVPTLTKSTARGYGCGGIEGKSDTGTFGGSFSRGSQNDA